MIRTVWLAAACLVVLGAMAAGKVANTPAAQTTDEPLDGATVGSDLAREPLIKADRLEIAYVRQETPSRPTLQPIDPIVPEAPKMISPAETNIVSRHWHDPNDTNSSTTKPKRTAKKGRSAADSRDSQAADRSKPGEQTKRCDRTATFSGLLRSLNLAPACDS
jgi:ribosomal protein S14